MVSLGARAHQTLTLGLEPTYHTLYLPMHIHTYTCPSNPKVGKCTRCARDTPTLILALTLTVRERTRAGALTSL